MYTAEAERKLRDPGADDWVRFLEPCFRPLYEAVLSDAGLLSDRTLLDVGCGAGLFCAMAAVGGARVSALDASPAFARTALARTPGLDARVGDMEALPFADASFDLVTGFNAFQHAGDPSQALREACRVLRPGGQLYAVVWGPPNECRAVAFLRALAGLLPFDGDGRPGPFALSAPGALDATFTVAGLVGDRQFGIDVPFLFGDEEAALRAVLSTGAGARAIQAVGEAETRAAVASAIAPYRRGDGSYRLENRYVAARAARPTRS